MKSSTLFTFLLVSAFSVGTANAAISWGEAITAGSTTLKASHINELRTQIQNLRNDVNAGSAGAWTNVTGGAIYYNGGNVGLGITNPSEKLDVAGMIRASSNIQSGNGSGGVAMTINDGYGNANITFNHLAGIPEQNGTAGRIVVNTDSTGGLGTMDFQLGGSVTSGVAVGLSSFMRLQSDGKVGIGTTGPGQNLSVAGTFGVSESGGNGGRLLVSSSGTGAVINQNDNSDIILQTQGVEKMRVRDNGEIDIPGTMELGANATRDANDIIEIGQNMSADALHVGVEANVTSTGTPTANRSTYGGWFNVTNDRGTATSGSRGYGYGVRGYANSSNAGVKKYYNSGGVFEGRNSNTAGMTHIRGINAQAFQNGTSGTVDSAYGVEGTTRGRSGATTSVMTNARGVVGTVYPYNTNVTNAKGVQGLVYTNNSYSGNITEARGVEGYVRHDSGTGATMGTGYGGRFEVSKRGAASNIGTTYGVWTSATGGTTNYGVYSNAGTNYFADNVGIGTTNPQAMLHVNDTADVSLTSTGHAATFGTNTAQNIAIDGNEIMARNNGAEASLYINNDGGDVAIHSAQGAGTQFVIKDNGNVGIGTTTPAEKLEVVGSAKINAGGNYTSLNIGSNSYDRLYADNTTAKSYGGGLWFRIQNAAGTGYNDTLRLAENGNIGVGKNPTVKLDVSGDIRTDGRNIYFGTAAQRLYGDNGSAFYADSNHSTITQMLFRDKEDTVYGRVYGSGNGGSFGLIDGDGDWGIQMVKDNFTRFNINGSESFRSVPEGISVGLSSANADKSITVQNDRGYVRMRTTPIRPNISLHSYGDTNNYLVGDSYPVLLGRHYGGNRTTNTNTKAGSYLFNIVAGGINSTGTAGNAANILFKAEADFVGASQPTSIIFRTGTVGTLNSLGEYDNNKEQMRITSIGNVGIGTNAPGQKLSVAGTLGVGEPGGTGGRLLVSSSAAGAVINQNDNSAIIFQSQGVEKMRIKSNGNVGIGNTNPARKLAVNGDVAFLQGTGDALYIDQHTIAGAPGPSIQAEGGDTLSIRPYGAGNVVINPTGSGLIGIGLAVPTEKLEVSGAIRSSGAMQVGNGSGSVAMTVNDGGGNANITFNHRARKPDVTGNAGRISVNVDATTGANMSFQLANGLTAGTVASTSEVFRVDADGKVRAQQYCDENGNNCGDASAGTGIILGTQAPTNPPDCAYHPMSINDLGMNNNKVAFIYKTANSGYCQQCTVAWDGTIWSGCSCTNICGP